MSIDGIHPVLGFFLAALAPAITYIGMRYTRQAKATETRTADWARFTELAEDAVERRITERQEWWERRFNAQHHEIADLRRQVAELERQFADVLEKYWTAIRHIRLLRRQSTNPPALPDRIHADV